MTVKFKIPEQAIIGFIKILTLEESTVAELESLFDAVPTTFDLDGVRSSLVSQLTSIPPKDAEEVFSVLYGLYALKHNEKITSYELADELYKALQESNSEDLKAAAADPDKVKERFAKLLNGKLFEIVIKATTLVFAHEHVLQDIKILTDVRSVFGDSPEQFPVAAIVVHKLKLTYNQDNQLKDFFVALDTEDVQVLIDTLERAKKKAESLKSLLAKASIPYIAPE